MTTETTDRTDLTAADETAENDLSVFDLMQEMLAAESAKGERKARREAAKPNHVVTGYVPDPVFAAVISSGHNPRIVGVQTMVTDYLTTSTKSLASMFTMRAIKSAIRWCSRLMAGFGTEDEKRESELSIKRRISRSQHIATRRFSITGVKYVQGVAQAVNYLTDEGVTYWCELPTVPVSPESVKAFGEDVYETPTYAEPTEDERRAAEDESESETVADTIGELLANEPELVEDEADELDYTDELDGLELDEDTEL